MSTRGSSYLQYLPTYTYLLGDYLLLWVLRLLFTEIDSEVS